MRHVSQHLPAQTIRPAERIAALFELVRHAIERSGNAGDLVASGIGGARSGVPTSEPFGRVLQLLQSTPGGREDDRRRQRRCDDQEERPRKRQHPPEVPYDSAGKRRGRRDDDEPDEALPDLNGRHHDRPERV